jgi:asparagine synthase (glutamine-hydrolysing)
MIEWFRRQLRRASSYVAPVIGVSVLRMGLSPTARKVRADRLTYLSEARLRNIEICLRAISTSRVPGLCLETGVALGGSGILIATLAADRTYRGYDVFARIPPPSDRDDDKAKARFDVITSGESKGIGGDPYYGYVDDLYEAVVKSFGRYGLTVGAGRVQLHRGLFEDTLRLEKDERVALAHIDCDWYEPVLFCLEQIGPRLSPGGFIIVDDYHDYAGCKRATDEYLAAHADLEIVRADSNVVLRRK